MNEKGTLVERVADAFRTLQAGYGLLTDAQLRDLQERLAWARANRAIAASQEALGHILVDMQALTAEDLQTLRRHLD